MGDVLNQLPEEIQSHIKNIASLSGLPETDESYEKIAAGWLEKQRLFETEIAERGMVEIDSFDRDNEKGGVALTYSGSLLLVGPVIESKRKSSYNSIGMRKDVPDSIIQENSELADDVYLNEPITFDNGPVKKTSPIYKFAVCQDESPEEQEKNIAEATLVLTKGFVDVNKALVPLEPSLVA